MKLRRLAVGASVLAVVGVSVMGCQRVAQGPAYKFSSHDSPIDVAGGSIYGTVGLFNLNTWGTSSNSKLYGSRSTNNDYITLVGFSGPQPFVVQNTGGWLISVTTNNPQGQPNQKPSISFCSSLDSSQLHCDEKSLYLDKGKIVYLEATSDTGRWDWSRQWWKHRLKFDDVQPRGCVGTESVCDQIVSIQITTLNSIPSLTTSPSTPPSPPSGPYTYGPYTCSNYKNCLIEVGQ
jgi:hypothetical protein